MTGHYPVVICGGGPTGLALSALLSQYGVASALFEQRQTAADHPQAHYINNRTMEASPLLLWDPQLDLSDCLHELYELLSGSFQFSDSYAVSLLVYTRNSMSKQLEHLNCMQMRSCPYTRRRTAGSSTPF